MYKVQVSTPSRICLFGEHQDYLGLEVIASAVDLRFSASATPRKDKRLVIRIRDKSVNYLGARNENGLYEETVIDLTKPIVYESKRDYLKSSVNVLLRNGYVFENGFDIKMDSEIPIGKGMCSSTTMIIALIKLLLELLDSEYRDDPEKIAQLGFMAEVSEFNEPGGMMDHYTSAYGGLVHLKFSDKTEVHAIDRDIPGCFILFDSLEEKNTIQVLADAKIPVLAAIEELKKYGITGVKDFYDDPENNKYLDFLDDTKKTKLRASIDNYRILKEAESMLQYERFSPEAFGRLISQHHANLRDGLGISTPTIEKILNQALKNGALGGKINGSGGGGCVYVYAYEKDCDRIIKSVEDIGYTGKKLKKDSGVRKDREENI